MSADTGTQNKLFKYLDKAAHIAETFLVTICLGAMVIIVLCQIFMRNFLDSGFVVGDPLVKHLVLWITFLGASLASKSSNHIRIDIANRFFPEKLKPAVQAVVDFFSTAICAILAIASYRFLMTEKEFGTSFGMTEIPVWILELIIPIGFAIIGLRFAINGIKKIVEMIKRS